MEHLDFPLIHQLFEKVLHLHARWTPMDYFLSGYIKSKGYVQNYENISGLKAAIICAFQEMSDGMVTSIMKNFGRRL